VTKTDWISNWADMLALLVKAPRTVAELSELTGSDRTTIYRWRDALVSEGLIKKCGKTASGADVWIWSPPTKDNP
jgi:DNA-binding IclR family transcriptional regulator